MTGISNCTLLGTLAEPVEVLQTKTGKPWVKAVIEVKTYRRGTDGEAGQEETTWIPIHLFSRQAEIAQKYLQVGDALAVTVRVSGTEFKAQNGGPVKRGVSLSVDSLHLIPNGRSQARKGDGNHARV